MRASCSEGTTQLVTAGEDTAKSYGHEYAMMQALNTKGAENAMPYGTPEGSADNRGAYDITIRRSAARAGWAARGAASSVSSCSVSVHRTSSVTGTGAFKKRSSSTNVKPESKKTKTLRNIQSGKQKRTGQK